MKIALVNTFSSFIRGGAEILVDDLQEQLEAHGHAVDLFRLPFPSEYEIQLPELALAAKLFDFSAYDTVIAFKFPAYCVCHKDKRLWMFHQFRQVYDLFGVPNGLPENARTQALKDIITSLDCREIGEADRVFVNAQEVANRLRHYNGLSSEILLPPLKRAELYHTGEMGDYFYYPSRVDPLKRQHLAVEAMRYVKTDVRLVIDGQCSDIRYDEKLKNLIREYDLKEKIEYSNAWVEDSEKIEKLANALGVLYIPYLEDSCGFVTYEGFYSGKPVLSFTDSGGTKEFISDGQNGFLTEPTPQALAEKMDTLYTDRQYARTLGDRARQDIFDKKITWDETVRRLLA